MKKTKAVSFALCLLLACTGLWSCMGLDSPEEENPGDLPAGHGLFVVNEGNFMYGTATLSFYSPGERTVENEVFSRANSMKLGDVAQSMVIRGDKGYIAVNNSGVIFVIDVNTCKVTGLVQGLVSPRYIHFVSDTKAYVTDLYSPYIVIFNPATSEITGRIDTGGHNSTEQMVQYDKYVFANCWSMDNKILVVDTETDTVTEEIEVGKQPNSLVLDKFGKIWTVTDGGYKGSQAGQEAPALYRIDAATRTVDGVFTFASGEHLSEICINGGGDAIYFINKGIWRMPVTDNTLPAAPFIADKGTIFYGLGVDPETSEVYVADAIDYQQPGIVYRYSADGTLTDSFKVGVNPGAFCFR